MRPRLAVVLGLVALALLVPSSAQAAGSTPKISLAEAAYKAPLAAEAEIGDAFPADHHFELVSVTRQAPRKILVELEVVSVDESAGRVHTPVSVTLSRPKARSKAPGGGKRAFYIVGTSGSGWVEPEPEPQPGPPPVGTPVGCTQTNCPAEGF